jgi:hypothetical protein
MDEQFNEPLTCGVSVSLGEMCMLDLFPKKFFSLFHHRKIYDKILFSNNNPLLPTCEGIAVLSSALLGVYHQAISAWCLPKAFLNEGREMVRQKSLCISPN